MNIPLRRLFITIILLTVTACQTTSLPSTDADLPTVFVLPSATLPPTQTPTITATFTVTPTRTVTPSPTITDTPIPPTLTPLPTTTFTPAPTHTPTLDARDLPARFVFGRTVEGRELIARTYGNGPTILMLVGGIHAGFEANTVELMTELAAHFESTPGDVLPGMTLLLIPSLNPDGLVLGRVLRGRFNANNVDLNRNWGCGWDEEAFFRDQVVNAGPAPFSEPETLALAALIDDLRPATVLFYHAAANGVFAGRCGGGDRSEAMAAVLGAATGYPHGESFNSYPVTGTAPGWVDGLGIPSADVELASASTTEFARNLRGIMALQCWLLGDAARNLATCDEM